MITSVTFPGGRDGLANCSACCFRAQVMLISQTGSGSMLPHLDGDEEDDAGCGKQFVPVSHAIGWVCVLVCVCVWGVLVG